MCSIFLSAACFFGLYDRVSDTDNLPHLNMAEALLVYAAFIGVTLLAAQGLHRFIENPWRERSRRFAKRGPLGLVWLVLLALFCIVQLLNR